jgi:trk system potassium uptake protein
MTRQSPKNYVDSARHLLDRTAHNVTHHGFSVAVRIVLGLFFLIILGSVLLMLPGMGAERPLTLAEATFTATSALTVTGLSIITPSTDLTLLGKIVLLILIQIGGVGFMFIAVILLQLLGRKILLHDRLALKDSLGLDSPQAILALLKRTFIGVVMIEAFAALLLWYNWLRFFPPVTALGYAIFHSISAFCNAGFDLFNGATDKNDVPFTGLPTDDFSLAVLGTLILLGGLGIPVIGELLTFKKNRRYSINTRITLRVVLGLTLLGWFGLYLSEAAGTGVLAEAPLDSRLIRTLFQSISNRTAGFAGLPDYHRLDSAAVLLTIAMMFVGCAPASMGGGITTGTFSVLTITLVSYVRGHNPPRVFNRTIEVTTMQRAGAILTIALVLLSLSTWLILLTNPHIGFEQVFFEVVSAFATCGLSLGITGDLNWFGRLIIIILMFWGRLGPLTVVIAVAQNRRNAQNLVRYPEEQILIG